MRPLLRLYFCYAEKCLTIVQMSLQILMNRCIVSSIINHLLRFAAKKVSKSFRHALHSLVRTYLSQSARNTSRHISLAFEEQRKDTSYFMFYIMPSFIIMIFINSDIYKQRVPNRSLSVLLYHKIATFKTPFPTSTKTIFSLFFVHHRGFQWHNKSFLYIWDRFKRLIHLSMYISLPSCFCNLSAVSFWFIFLVHEHSSLHFSSDSCDLYG